ncbi:hypothetical protein EVAR_47003_1 [Eumeta japonica]|uniref:Uncharacterized protein n=1 Tax=Eumeta variegata TaxID=151549 RepID=A0A4C1X7B9_EUMVA|nr:hypothetical protein EVAR_47003_1 [Eumeta japonica]
MPFNDVQTRSKCIPYNSVKSFRFENIVRIVKVPICDRVQSERVISAGANCGSPEVGLESWHNSLTDQDGRLPAGDLGTPPVTCNLVLAIIEHLNDTEGDVRDRQRTGDSCVVATWATVIIKSDGSPVRLLLD